MNKKSKSKRMRHVRMTDERRILQLSENPDKGGTRREWRDAAAYWHHLYVQKWNELGSMRCHIAATVKGQEIFKMGLGELKTWLERQTPHSTA